jgi:small subunit ribosomal protein S6
MIQSKTIPNRNALLALPEKVKLESQKEDKKLANRLYEVMYIAAPEKAEDDITKLNDAITSLVEKDGGTVSVVEGWGRRRLAYPINKKTEGFYVLLEIAGSGQEIAELERRFRVNDVIMRYMTVRVDEDRKAADKKRNKRESKRRSNRTGQPDYVRSNEAESADEAQDA